MNTFLLAADFLQVRPGLIAWTLLPSCWVLVVLRWKAWGPILSLVEEREKQITAPSRAPSVSARGREAAADQKTAIAEAAARPRR